MGCLPAVGPSLNRSPGSLGTAALLGLADSPALLPALGSRFAAYEPEGRAWCVNALRSV
jgi:hypothetical protein